VVFTMRADDLAVLLVQRKNEPFKGQWALPGGFVNENESLERAATRELSEETGLGTNVRLEQLATFGDPGRDPRGHTVTVAYVTYLVAEAKITAGDDAAAAEWHAFRSLDLRGQTGKKPSARRGTRRGRTSRSSGALVPVAFDHGKIITQGYQRLLQCLDDPLRRHAFELLPSRFTLAELHHFYEIVSGRSLPERAFRKRLFDYELVLPATSKPTAKPSEQLYRWNR
jgi:8-oxo-dGTP diphosphatase